MKRSIIFRVEKGYNAPGPYLVAVQLVDGHPAPPDLGLVENVVVDQRRNVDHLRDLSQLFSRTTRTHRKGGRMSMNVVKQLGGDMRR